jgi:hydroxypyruvate reductase
MSPNLPDRPDAARVALLRQQAREIFDHALAECSISKAFGRCIGFSDGKLEIGECRYDLREFPRVAVVSIGKAGHSMASALSQIVPTNIGGIIACPGAPNSLMAGFRNFYGGHPLPNEESLRAGAAILKFLQGLPQRSLVLFLISGGASAIAEKPIHADLTLSDVIETNRALVLSGAPIAQINTIRKHLSATKGGRMAKVAAPSTQVSLLVSDVPDHAIDALASGPTMPDSSTVADCYGIVRSYDLIGKFPERVRLIFESEELSETPKRGDAAFMNSQYLIVMSNQTAVEAATVRATGLGFTVEVDNSCDDWDYAKASEYLLARLSDLRQKASPVCLISGGEVTVTVTNKSGIGGRNQQFALCCAENIAGESIAVLSAGTDGIDGNSPAAGAVVDDTTVARALERGLNVASALSRFDAFPLLEAIGDTIITGPTGNNVRDLRVLLAY